MTLHENNIEIYRRYHMAARRHEISLRVSKNISRVSAANEWNIFSTREEKFRISKRPCNVYSLYKHQWNTKPFHFKSFLVWKARLYFIQWCCERGAKTHRKRTKKKPWRKRQSRSWRFSFHKYFATFFIYFLFSITLLYHFFSIPFFTHDIYPHPRPHPRPTTFSYTQSKAFCSSGNLEQVLHFWATFGQNIGLCQVREKWAVW